MRTSDLDREIQNTLSSGGIPLMVNATCGTTVLGAYDPVDKIADICQKYDVWLHVDVSFHMLSSIICAIFMFMRFLRFP